MISRSRQGYALFSVAETHRIVEFAHACMQVGWTIVASEPPLSTLRAAGIPAVDVADFVGVDASRYPFPPTLHPKIEWALTDASADIRLELVYDIPYGPALGNDVGGHTLLGLAAKGNRLPVATVTDMEQVARALGTTGTVPADLRQALIDAANLRVMRHYASLVPNGPDHQVIVAHTPRTLLNGENPYQVPAVLLDDGSGDPLGLVACRQVLGNPPCLTNLADADSLISTLVRLSAGFRCLQDGVPFLAIAAKHGNPCGIGWHRKDPLTAIRRALWANPGAIWGGEVAVNFPLDTACAEALFADPRRAKSFGSERWMLDVVLAPDADAGACNQLGQRRLTKLFLNDRLADPDKVPHPSWQGRLVRGGLLRQPPADYVLDLATAEVDGSWPDTPTQEAMVIAWAAAFSSNQGGNEVALACPGALLAVGGGPATVEAAELAVLRARRAVANLNIAENTADIHALDATGMVFAADAFFPFTDGPEILTRAGCRHGVVPSGGMRFDVVRTFLRDQSVGMVYLDERYRGFCRH
ncbi:MAG: hypothetical protein HQL65_00540 [Magnetococcales bacterium]|nr:hypothetical protein [Magnetococcales bacterium]